jgi:2-C-methyl-D-erythritol 4-phosphate cytidylyltransferase
MEKTGGGAARLSAGADIKVCFEFQRQHGAEWRCRRVSRVFPRNMPDFCLILPAAGKSTRFGGSRSKLLEPLDGVPVIARALRPFLDRNDLIRAIIPCGDPVGLDEAIQSSNDKRILLCAGGPSRAHSVLEALKRVPAEVEWVAVHDAARPLISAALIESALTAATRHGAAVPALPAALTIKLALGPLPAKVERTLLRAHLWAMQTPQVMRRADLLDAFARCPIPLDQVTDDVQLLELAGKEVWLIPGEERNLKMTTAIDLHQAQWWLRQSP